MHRGGTEAREAPPRTRPRFLTAAAFANALHKAGVIDGPDRITRIVIDVRPGHEVVLHVRYVGDTRLLEVTDLLAGAEVVTGE